MPEHFYNIIFEGKLQEGASLPRVRQRLAKLFGLPQEKVERLFSGSPVALKRHVRQPELRKYFQIFDIMGVRCAAIRESDSSQPSQTEQPYSLEPPSDSIEEAFKTTGYAIAQLTKVNADVWVYSIKPVNILALFVVAANWLLLAINIAGLKQTELDRGTFALLAILFIGGWIFSLKSPRYVAAFFVGSAFSASVLFLNGYLVWPEDLTIETLFGRYVGIQLVLGIGLCLLLVFLYMYIISFLSARESGGQIMLNRKTGQIGIYQLKDFESVTLNVGHKSRGGNRGHICYYLVSLQGEIGEFELFDTYNLDIAYSHSRQLAAFLNLAYIDGTAPYNLAGCANLLQVDQTIQRILSNYTRFLVPPHSGIRIYAGPNIPERKLFNALRSYVDAPNYTYDKRTDTILFAEEPVILIDTTALESGKQGALITDTHLYTHEPGSKTPLKVTIAELTEVHVAPKGSDGSVLYSDGKAILDVDLPQETMWMLAWMLQDMAVYYYRQNHERKTWGNLT